MSKRLLATARSIAQRRDAISAGIAISLMQDATEMLLWTLIKEMQVEAREGLPFTQYFDAIEKAGAKVPHRNKLLELNKARVGFKHWGNLPATKEVEKHDLYVEEFLRDSMLQYFGIRYEDLSLMDLISDAEVRAAIQDAATARVAGQHGDCAGKLAIAKQLLLWRVSEHFPSLSLGASMMAAHGRFGMDSRQFGALQEQIELLREGVIVSMIRLPLASYRRLQMLPPVFKMPGGDWTFQLMRDYGDDDCEACMNDLIEMAVLVESILV
jgi:hypothetical protein